MSDVVRCYECGRIIDENEILMKDVSSGFLGLQTDRKPFHAECWKEYNRRKQRKILLTAILFLIIVTSPIWLTILVVFLLGGYT